MDYTRLTNLDVTGDIKAGTVHGALTGVAISTGVNFAPTEAEKENLAFLITLTAGSKTVTLGLPAGKVAFVVNAGPTNTFTVKNVAADTGTSLEAGKILFVVGSTETDGSTVLLLN